MKKQAQMIALAVLASACSPMLDEGAVNEVETAVREGLASRGEVKQVELSRENDNRLSGFAIVQMPGGAEGRFTCTAEREGGTGSRFNWRCEPPAVSGAGGGNNASAAELSSDERRLVGSWGSGDCSAPVVLSEDGMFRMPDGTGGRWSLEGRQLMLSGGGGEQAMQVGSIEADSWTAQFPDGTEERLQRC